jgi:hypothetical protein
VTKLVLSLLAVALLGFGAWFAVHATARPAEPDAVPTQQLDSARQAAKRIEAGQDQQAADVQKAADTER